MKLYKYSIPAGESRTVNARGRFIRGMAGNERYQLQLEGKSVTDFETGIAMEVADYFQSFRLINPTAETLVIEVAVSDYPVDDNRLVAHLTAEGLLQVVTSGGSSRTISQVAVLPGVAKQLLANDTARLKAALAFQMTGRLGADNTVTAAVGFPVALGGVWNDNNTSELWILSTAGGTVDIIEEAK